MLIFKHSINDKLNAKNHHIDQLNIQLFLYRITLTRTLARNTLEYMSQTSKHKVFKDEVQKEQPALSKLIGGAINVMAAAWGNLSNKMNHFFAIKHCYL